MSDIIENNLALDADALPLSLSAEAYLDLDSNTLPPSPRFCRNCNTMKSGRFRKSPLGPATVCNSCGLKWMRTAKKINRWNWHQQHLAEYAFYKQQLDALQLLQTQCQTYILYQCPPMLQFCYQMELQTLAQCAMQYEHKLAELLQHMLLG